MNSWTIGRWFALLAVAVIVVLAAWLDLHSLPLLFGVMLIASGLFSPLLNRWLGLPERGSLFTNPRYQQSARIAGILSRIVLICLGVGSLMEGISLLTGNQVVSAIGWGLVGSAAVGLVAIIGVTVFFRQG